MPKVFEDRGGLYRFLVQTLKQRRSIESECENPKLKIAFDLDSGSEGPTWSICSEDELHEYESRIKQFQTTKTKRSCQGLGSFLFFVKDPEIVVPKGLSSCPGIASIEPDVVGGIFHDENGFFTFLDKTFSN